MFMKPTPQRRLGSQRLAGESLEKVHGAMKGSSCGGHWHCGKCGYNYTLTQSADFINLGSFGGYITLFGNCPSCGNTPYT